MIGWSKCSGDKRDSRGSWSVVTTARSPKWQIDAFVAAYLELGADEVFVFFDDPEAADFTPRARLRAIVCDEKYWSKRKRPIGRPPEIEPRQYVNHGLARRLSASAWLLHVDSDELVHAARPVHQVLAEMPDDTFSVVLRSLEAVYAAAPESEQMFATPYFKDPDNASPEVVESLLGSELSQCAYAGLWGHALGKTFVRAGQAIRRRSCHRPVPKDEAMKANVRTRDLELLHFEAMTYPLFREKIAHRMHNDANWKFLGGRQGKRLDIMRRAYSQGDDELKRLYDLMHVFEPGRLDLARQSGLVVTRNRPDEARPSHPVIAREPRAEGVAQRDAAPDDGRNPAKEILLYYWEGKPNFGDVIGPWLVQMMTGRPTRNIRAEGREALRGLATVGSLLHSLDRPDLEVWGSGSMYKLSARRVEALRGRKPKQIHAVRGWLSYREMTRKLGWAVPKIYGDPALLLPRFFSPAAAPAASGKIAVVPHYNHKTLFKNLRDDDGVRQIDVLQPPDVVVSEIASSRCVLSTSLHGVICAQAYEVPWVWIRLPDHDLRGGDFKFEDFFTVLERESVLVAALSPQDITAETMRKLAEAATIPASKFNFDDLLGSFPYDQCERGPQ